LVNLGQQVSWFLQTGVSVLEVLELGIHHVQMPLSCNYSVQPVARV
jgi:hypothetical protein